MLNFDVSQKSTKVCSVYCVLDIYLFENKQHALDTTKRTVVFDPRLNGYKIWVQNQ